MITNFDYDAIVVGAGHAGTEAAHALATLGKNTLMLCLKQKSNGESSMQSINRWIS